ncbi:MAG: polysaccharide deacetylase family protein [Bacilli bacterium]|jgi:peptidoglycan-N-acetylmuramic acid deacetylase|nr:polysaccharide deacetylase family protein [Bacilli bacterium]
MEQKHKRIILGITFLIFLSIIFICYQTISKNEKKTNKAKQETLAFTLKGQSMVTIKVGEKYQEPGYEAIDKEEGNITSKVSVKSTLNIDIPGTYQITYTITNKKGNKKELKRFVTVEGNKIVKYKDAYDNIDNTHKTWWSGNKKDHTRPVDGAGNKEDVLKQYGAYYMGPDEKIIYLTFDEGSNDTYTEEIVDVLNENDVKATFFFCKGFMKNNPELMKKIAQSGHSVGNHTANHYSMPTLATRTNFQKYLNEIEENEKVFKEITGVEMDKVYREPKGEYSYRSLQIVHDLGYKSYFWSADHYDFDYDVSKEKAFSELEKRYHNGAIYLLHPKNRGNYEAMDSFIKHMKNLGYTFGLVRDIQ